MAITFAFANSPCIVAFIFIEKVNKIRFAKDNYRFVFKVIKII